MKNLSKLLFAALLVAIAFGSCKKSSSNKTSSSTPVMKFTSNGSVVSFNTCIAVAALVGNSQQTLITANNVTNGNVGTSTFQVQIDHDIASLKAGQTYAAATTFGQQDGSALLYFPNNSDFFATQPGNPQGSVTVTDITSGDVTGPFSGKLFTQDDYAGADVKYTITDGTFVASRSN